MRATIMADDIARCIALHGRVEMQFLLAEGWPLEELECCEHTETRLAARGYAEKVAAMEHRSLVALIACLAVATAIIFGTLLADLTIPGV